MLYVIIQINNIIYFLNIDQQSAVVATCTIFDNFNLCLATDDSNSDSICFIKVCDKAAGASS